MLHWSGLRFFLRVAVVLGSGFVLADAHFVRVRAVRDLSAIEREVPAAEQDDNRPESPPREVVATRDRLRERLDWPLFALLVLVAAALVPGPRGVAARSADDAWPDRAR